MIRENDDSVYKVTFSYVDNRGQNRIFTERTTEVEDITDESTELILYNPGDESQAMALDVLEGKIGVNERGEWNPPTPAPVILKALLIAICYLPHGLILLSKVVR